MFGIEKDPVPAQAVEVSTDEGDKGVFILFVNPVDYIELVEEDGTPTSEEEVIKMKMSFLIGLMVNKDNPQKTQLSFIPPEFLLKLKEIPEEKPLILEEDLDKENKKQSLDN
ncbi:MAG: hypothetical protein Q9M89_09330 [Persephonella sp.]|nr:hypothetical protein [Persephonella sp.]